MTDPPDTPTTRIRVTYRLEVGGGESAEERTAELAREQTVELPDACLSDELRAGVVGRVERVDAVEEGVFRAVVSFEPDLVGGELGPLMNLLFGNVSMQAAVRVEEVAWPSAFLDRLAGPRFGLPGLRDVCAADGRPLVCAALKPLGLSARALAGRARELALAGVDLIKDDHSLLDQPAAPFAERVRRCQEAVREANAETGGGAVYFPNLAGDSRLPERVEQVLEAGCYGALVSPMVLGLGTVAALADETGLALLGHPALAGAFFRSDHGIVAPVLLGELFRMAGCDGVIYPNAGGRFELSTATCEAINDALTRKLGHLLPAVPVPGGGLDPERVPEWVGRYGNDIMLLLGTGLYRQGDLRGAAERLVAAAHGAAAGPRGG